MGLIKVFKDAVSSTWSDQWKEFFYCDAMEKDVLVTKGQKRVTRRSQNKGSDNIISDGSGIAVADGQCMCIVEQGKIIELCAVPGEYKFDKSAESSVFSGSLGERIGGFFKTVGRRTAYGGDTGRDQRVYYFNIKELLDNKFGTPNPVPFRVVDHNIGLDIDVSVRCSGIFSYRIANPLLFYKNVCGNVEFDYKREKIDAQLKSEFISALQPGFGKLSAMEMRPNQIPAHTTELEVAMNEALNEKWQNLRGLEICSIAINTITLPEEDQKLIKEAQRQAIYRDPSMAAASLVGAQGDAMRAAASNANGAMMGFYGMNMASQAGGFNANNLFGMAQQNQQQQAAQAAAAQRKAEEEKAAQEAAAMWTCTCGARNKGKFCVECGKTNPNEFWTCSCGAKNKGKFCAECGAKKPAGALLYRCDKCGWEPEDPTKPPKFCPQCGDPFDDKDIR